MGSLRPRLWGLGCLITLRWVHQIPILFSLLNSTGKMCLLGPQKEAWSPLCYHLFPQGLYWDYSPRRSGELNNGWSQLGFSWMLLQLSTFHRYGPKIDSSQQETQRKCLHVGNARQTFIVQINYDRRSLFCSLGLLPLQEALPHFSEMEAEFWSLETDLEGPSLGSSL